ncbi:hypothetical protein V7659_15730 [Neobacillus drentensis]
MPLQKLTIVPVTPISDYTIQGFLLLEELYITYLVFIYFYGSSGILKLL